MVWKIAWVILCLLKNYFHTIIPLFRQRKEHFIQEYKGLRRSVLQMGKSQNYRTHFFMQLTSCFSMWQSSCYPVAFFSRSMHNFFQVEQCINLHLNLHLCILYMCMFISPGSDLECENMIHTQKSLRIREAISYIGITSRHSCHLIK